MPGVRIRIDGARQLSKKLEMAMRRIKHPTSFMHVAMARSYREVMRHFEQEQGPAGRWRPLAQPRERGGTKVLQDTGRLKGSIRHRVLKGGKAGMIFTNIKYALQHQRGKGWLPARPFIWLPKGLLKKFAGMYAKFARKDLK